MVESLGNTLEGQHEGEGVDEYHISQQTPAVPYQPFHRKVLPSKAFCVTYNDDAKSNLLTLTKDSPWYTLFLLKYGIKLE